MTTPLLMFLVFIAVTLVITSWAARRSSGASAYFAAGRRITGWQNGIAVAGDYMSAASVPGHRRHHRLPGLRRLHVLGGLAGGLSDGAADRGRAAAQRRQVHDGRRAGLPSAARAGARHGLALSTLTVSTFYMIAQMVGAGTLVALLLKDPASRSTGGDGVGHADVVYVVFGGMLATTWVQIIKAILLMGGTVLLSMLVLAHFGFSFGAFFDAIAHVERRRQGGQLPRRPASATSRRTARST